MTELLPTSSTGSPVPAAFRPGVLLDPDGLDVVELGASVHADLGPDWSALRAFAGIITALAVASLVGHRVDGPAGIVIASGLVALVLFVAAHVRAWSTARRLDRLDRLGGLDGLGRTALDDRPTVPVIDIYASIGDAQSRSAATGPVMFLWRCDVCRVVSIEAATRPEAVDLAGTHDRLHHGRPCADVVAVSSTPSASTTGAAR